MACETDVKGFCFCHMVDLCRSKCPRSKCCIHFLVRMLGKLLDTYASDWMTT